MRTAVIFIFFAVIYLFILFPSESPVPQASRPPNYITLTLSRCFCISLFPPPPRCWRRMLRPCTARPWACFLLENPGARLLSHWGAWCCPCPRTQGVIYRGRSGLLIGSISRAEAKPGKVLIWSRADSVTLDPSFCICLSVRRSSAFQSRCE